MPPLYESRKAIFSGRESGSRSLFFSPEFFAQMKPVIITEKLRSITANIFIFILNSLLTGNTCIPGVLFRLRFSESVPVFSVLQGIFNIKRICKCKQRIEKGGCF